VGGNAGGREPCLPVQRTVGGEPRSRAPREHCQARGRGSGGEGRREIEIDQTRGLKAMADKKILNFINGEYVASESGKTFENRHPVDGRLVGIVSEAGKEEVDAAVNAARAALEGPWKSMDIAKRSELLYAVADEINRRFNDFLDAEVADTGKPHNL